MKLRFLLTTSLSLVALSGPLGCRAAPKDGAHDPKPAPTSPNAIPAAPLSGSINGHPFAVRTARYIVDRRPDHEKLEIHLSAAEVAGCEDDGAKHITDVWLRRAGSAMPTTEPAHIAPDQPSPWEVHYEAYEDGKWTGNSRASALLVIRSRTDGNLDGDLSVCFGDASASCVSGTFSARGCPIRIDAPVRGAPAMERLPDGLPEPLGAPGADGG